MIKDFSGRTDSISVKGKQNNEEKKETKMKYTQEELNTAFEKVQNPSHWKAPVISYVKPEERDIIREAIIHFTGTVPEFGGVLPCGWMKVTAPGYWAGPCGDH